MIQDIIDDPVYPSHWGKNQKGMQAQEVCFEDVLIDNVRLTRVQAWDDARQFAIEAALGFDEAGYHKQIINRLLEPFSHINVVVTATEWNNFFHLRCHKDAQPEMRLLAEAIFSARDGSTPKNLQNGDWHLPYVNKDDWTDINGGGDITSDQYNTMIKLSAARCARVSYLTTEGKVPTLAEDLSLYDRLVGSEPIHGSPCEHQATPDMIQQHLHGNFTGWIQYRKTLPNENIEG